MGAPRTSAGQENRPGTKNSSIGGQENRPGTKNSSIGIIICKSKDKTVVQYALKEANKPIGIFTYRTSSKLPKEIKKYRPSPREIEKRLSVFTSLEGSKKAEFE
jgi:hypothetical protein